MVFQGSRSQFSIKLAVVASLIFHGLVLCVPLKSPQAENHLPTRINATLAPRTQKVQTVDMPPVLLSNKTSSKKPKVRQKILALHPSQKAVYSLPTSIPQWTVAEKEGMNEFLNELDEQVKARPDLVQRSLAKARQIAREQVGPSDEGSEVLERLANSPPVDPFSLEMYLDSLVKKLNRSADFVRRDPKSKGVRTAAVQIRLNPNGSLKSFQVLNSADQQNEIAFIKNVVEQAVPFSPFPADILRSAQSLVMVICILPANLNGGGFGFTRNPGGRGC